MTDVTDIHRGHRPVALNWTGRGRLSEIMFGVVLANMLLTALLMFLGRSTFTVEELGAEILRAEGLVGTTIFSVVGALAMRARLKSWSVKNWVLIFASAFLTANGGGTLRDFLLKTSPFWWKSPEYLIIPLTVSAFAFVVRSKKLPIIEPVLRLNDSFATGIFVMIGVTKVVTALEIDHSVFLFAAVWMGTITGVFGGMLRDLLLFRKVPTAVVGMGLVNAFLCSSACAVWMSNPPLDIGDWAWLPAGCLMLLLNSATSGRTFSYR